MSTNNRRSSGGLGVGPVGFVHFTWNWGCICRWGWSWGLVTWDCDGRDSTGWAGRVPGRHDGYVG